MKIEFGDRVICFKKLNSKILLSSSVFDGGAHLPSSIFDCIEAASFLNWNEGVRLSLEGTKVLLYKEVDKLSDRELQEFSVLAEEWQEIIEHFIISHAVC